MTRSSRFSCWRAAFCALGVLVLTGCGATVTARVRSEHLTRTNRATIESVLGAKAHRASPATAARDLKKWAGANPDRLVTASKLILGLGAKQRTEKAGYALMAAQLAWSALTIEQTPAALAAYDNTLQVFIAEKSGAIAAGKIEPVETPDGIVPVAVRYPKSGPPQPGYFDNVVVAGRVSIRGFRQRAVVDGIGVALVGIRKNKPGREKEMADRPQKGITMAISCAAQFSKGGGAEIVMLNPIREETIRLGGRAVPLAADFTAPLALALGGVNDLMLGIRNLLNVSAGADDAGVYLVDPFDPKRIPVLLIHGLSSTPLVWRNVVSAALNDPVIRRNYQFWYAYYPTGAPVVASAAMIRDDIARARRQYDPRGNSAAREIDLVGYSMGGNIARILASNIGNRLWNELASVPFDDVKLDPDDREQIRDTIFWRPVSGVKCVIFIATPHRGTRMADASFAHWARRLIRLPGDLLNLQSRFFDSLGDVLKGNSPIPSRVTGIDTLSAQSPLFKAWEGLPLEKGARFYSIIGDRGRGDTPDSSDGIVGYWSSHLEGAKSELIVPTGHDAQAYPGTEQEIIRILQRQLERSPRRRNQGM